MKKIISTFKFETKLYGSAEKIAKTQILAKWRGEMIAVTDGIVTNMPKKKEGVVYLVNAFVFEALKNSRDDLAMFDYTLTARDENGLIMAQGGFIFSNGGK